MADDTDDSLDAQLATNLSNLKWTPAPESCSTCKALWERGPNLFCRRYPPTVQIAMQPGAPMMIDGKVQQTMQKMIESQYPPTQKDHWCGEWRPKVLQ